MKRLRRLVGRLEHYHGRPRPPLHDPFALAVWESCAYLVSDERRAAVFRRLQREVGLSPRAIRSRSLASLATIIHDGGMLPRMRAEKLHAAADVALDVGLATLRRLVRRSPREARKVLRRFPGIAEPGADKILLFCRGERSLAPDSNALRVLIRLGYGRAGSNYGRQYRSAAAAVAPELPAAFDRLIAAHQLLRRHGQTVCTRSEPGCDICPLSVDCPSSQERPLAGRALRTHRMRGGDPRPTSSTFPQRGPV